jgi:hypothetical protein
MSTAKAKVSKPTMALAIMTLVLSSYGLYELMYNYAHAPWIFCVIAVAGFDLAALAAGKQALVVARDGDSPAPWAFLVVLLAAMSAVLQYAHNSLEGRPWPVGVMFATFPIVTVALFEGTLRRAYRLNGRLSGRVAPPRASFELMQWIVYPKATLWAFRRSVADRSLGGNAAFLLGIEATTSVEPEYVPETRREFEWDYTRPGGGGIRELSGSRPDDDPESAGEVPESAGSAPDTRPITVIVRESLQVRGADEEAVLADVLRARPDAKAESVRRTIRKESGPKKATA